MRHYPTNSPQAMSRLLAIAMIVDGRLAPQELKTLHRSRVLELAGVSEDTFDQTAGELGNDLMAIGAGSDPAGFAPHQIDRLLEDVQDPALRALVLTGMRAIVQADQLIDHREHRLLQQVADAWEQSGG